MKTLPTLLLLVLLTTTATTTASSLPLCRNSSLLLSSTPPLAAETDMRALAYSPSLSRVYVPFITSRVGVVDTQNFVRVHPTSGAPDSGAFIDTSPHQDFLAALLDDATHTLYLTTGTEGDLVALSLSPSPGVVGVLSLRAALSPPLPKAFFFAAVLDSDSIGSPATLAYFGEITGYVVKVDLTSMAVLSSTLLPGGDKLSVAALGGSGSLLVIASLNAGSGAIVAILNTNDLSLATPIRDYPSSSFTALTVDKAANVVYLASSYLSSSLMGLSMTPPAFNATTLPLAPSDDGIVSAVLLPDASHVLLGTDVSIAGTSSLIVVDVSSSSFSRLTSIAMDDGDISLVDGVATSPAENAVIFALRGASRMLRFSLAPANCSALSQCESCNAACGCGWCASSESCIAGDPTGPHTDLGEPSCPASAWDYYDCANCIASSSSCADCGSNPLCGWCASSQSCIRGNSAGPLTPSQCPVPDDWEFATCSVCSSHASCSSCVADTDCGWCPETQTCQRGIPGGSYESTCPSWSFGTCRSSLCATATTCTSCAVLDPHCGWCSSSQSCIEGNSSIPYNPALCPDGSLGYSGTSCPDCATRTSCANCSTTVDAPECGWCPSTGKCSHGSPSASYEESCDVGTGGWSYAPSGSCPVCASASGTDCGTCTSLPFCGWCASTSTCAPGSSSGPHASSGVTCPPTHWDYASSSGGGGCRECGSRDSCSSCQADGRCGWCYADGTCKAGDGSGPFATESVCSGDPGLMWETDGSCPALCDADPNAPDATMCSACRTVDPRCGWCASSQSCVVGNATGPLGKDAALCSVWDPGCDRCAAKSGSCSECTADPGCGFCSYTSSSLSSSCVSGDSRGPFSTTECPVGATDGEPVWLHGACTGGVSDLCDISQAAAEAGVAPSCGMCLAKPGCGWCPSAQACYTPSFSRCSRTVVTSGCPGYSYWYILVLAILLALITVLGLIWALVKLRSSLLGKSLSSSSSPSSKSKMGDDSTEAVGATVDASVVGEKGPGKELDEFGMVGLDAYGNFDDLEACDRTSSESDDLEEGEGRDGEGGKGAALALANREVVLEPPPYRVLGARGADVSGGRRVLLEELGRVVADGDGVLAVALTEVVRVSDDGDELARALMTFLQSDGEPLALLGEVLRREVDATQERSSNTLLRANSMASKLMKVFSSIQALGYVFLILRPYLLQALSEKDPDPLGPREGSEEPLELLEAVHGILERVLTSAGVVPGPFREAAQIVLHTLEESPFAHMSTRAVASFFFLRLLSPALCSPVAYGLVDEEADGLPTMTGTHQRNLITVSKVIQAIANQAPFTTRNTHLSGANGYILDAIPALNGFVASLGLEGEDAGDDAAARGVLAAPEFPIGRAVCVVDVEPNVREQALYALMELCGTYEAELRERLQDVGRSNTNASGGEGVNNDRPFDAVEEGVRSGRMFDAEVLVPMLKENHYALTSALVETTKREEHEDLAGALVLLFACESDLSVLQLVKVLAGREMRTITEPNMVLRSIHVPARVGSLWAALVGKSYRSWVLEPTLAAVSSAADAYDIESVSGEEGINRMLALIDLVSDLLDRVFNSLEELPVAFRSVAAHLNAVVGARFPDAWFLGPGRFFITHFIVPGLVRPRRPGPEGRVLRKIADILVHLVNDMQFAVEAQHHRALNEFVGRNVGVFHAFLVELCRIPEGAVLGSGVTGVFTPEERASAAAYVGSRVEFYVGKADFCYLYHFYWFLESAPEEEDGALNKSGRGGKGGRSGGGGGGMGGETEWVVMAELERILRAWRSLQ